MKSYRFLDGNGSFELENADMDLGLYFPIASETGLKSAITPNLAGDSKTDQNHFLLEPTSVENLNNNKSTRNFWFKVVREGKTIVWSATGNSARQEAERFSEEQEENKVLAGYMWHKTERISKKCGLSAEILSFMPIDNNVEIMRVTVTNNGTDKALIIPTAAIPVYGRSADNLRDHRHVTALLHRGRIVDYGLEITPTLSFDERGHQVNDTKYFVLGMEEDGKAPVGCFPETAQFLGHSGTYMWPEAVVTGNVMPWPLKFAPNEECKTIIPDNRSCRSGEIDGQELVGALRFEERELLPGESAHYTVFMGLCKREEAAYDRVSAYMSLKALSSTFETAKAHWLSKVNISIHTGDEQFDQFMAWVSFQPELRRIFGCSFLPHHDYGKGGRGWRDLWQDCLALLMMDPSGVREMLLGNFAGVRIDGTNATIIGEKRGEFKADRNSITRVWMDHGVWPMMTTKLYLDQTGDYSILGETAPYFKDRQVVRGTAVDELWNGGSGWQADRKGEEYAGTVLEHLLLQNVSAFYEVGEHNHIRLRDADWNDAIDMAGHRGESVAFTNAYAMNLITLADIIDRQEKNGINEITLLKEIAELIFAGIDYDCINDKLGALTAYTDNCRHSISGIKISVSAHELSENLRGKAAWMMEHIRRTEWTTDNDGNAWFNSYYDDNGRKVEGITEDGQVRMMLTGQVFSVMAGTATEEQVASIVRASDRYLYDENCGGYRLNTDFHEVKTDMGRMFGFAFGEKENGAVFSHMAVMYANALYGRGFAAEGYKSLQTLYWQSMNYSVSRIYPGIPEYFGRGGRGLYHYLTGAASWYLLTVVTEMFGVRGEDGGLVIEPKLLADQFDEKGIASVSLTFREKKLRVVFVNEGHKNFGEYGITAVKVCGRVLQAEGAGKYELEASIFNNLSTEKINEVEVILS